MEVCTAGRAHRAGKVQLILERSAVPSVLRFARARAPELCMHTLLRQDVNRQVRVRELSESNRRTLGDTPSVRWSSWALLCSILLIAQTSMTSARQVPCISSSDLPRIFIFFSDLLRAYNLCYLIFCLVESATQGFCWSARAASDLKSWKCVYIKDRVLDEQQGIGRLEQEGEKRA